MKPGGRLVYVTCSVLPEENDDQIAWFVVNHPDFAALPWRDSWNADDGQPPVSASKSEETLLLTPARHGTDGFFIVVLGRR